MKIYLGGGAVRDELLGLPVKEKDWVVTGASVEELIGQGFLPVGRDFPVFLHPQTKEEYALARTEKKSGHGYGGFTFYTAPDVTIEEDLYRRDLTINAIAKDEKGNLIDPYNGLADLKQGLLRHVSPAFIEDPLRILRVARFAARLFNLGFTVAPQTMALMRDISSSRELSFLSQERVWQETLKALNTTHPSTYFKTLYSCGALPFFFPELLENHEPAGVEQINLVYQALDEAAKDNQSSLIRFVCGFVPWKSCIDNSAVCCEQLSLMANRLKIPAKYRDMLLLVVRCTKDLVLMEKPQAEVVLRFLERTDAFRRKERFLSATTACDYLLNAAKEQKGQSAWLKKVEQACREVDIKSLINKGLKGKEVAAEICRVRLQIANAVLTGSQPATF